VETRIWHATIVYFGRIGCVGPGSCHSGGRLSITRDEYLPIPSPFLTSIKRTVQCNDCMIISF
jgi:hypothetical protein